MFVRLCCTRRFASSLASLFSNFTRFNLICVYFVSFAFAFCILCGSVCIKYAKVDRATWCEREKKTGEIANIYRHNRTQYIPIFPVKCSFACEKSYQVHQQSEYTSLGNSRKYVQQNQQKTQLLINVCRKNVFLFHRQFLFVSTFYFHGI